MKDNQAQFAMDGTLGDAFIVYCKLYNYWRKTGREIKLYRYSRHVNFDKPISGFFSNIQFVEYVMPCRYVDEYNKNFKKLKYIYLNTAWNGKSASRNEPDDPDYIKMEPFPESFIKKKNLNSDKFKVGIQLHCGKIGSNFKGFSLSWLRGVRRYLPSDQFAIYLFGTGDGYSPGKVDRFCQDNKIINLVSKTDFRQWLEYIKAMDFFITPEGFSAFFAMSQRVRSLVFFTYSGILYRVPPEWRRENIIMIVKQHTLLKKALNQICVKVFKRRCLLRPLTIAQVRSLIDSECVYK